MGQYFVFLNLDNPAPVRTSVGGKFGEFFFGMDTDWSIMKALWRPEKGYKRVTAKPFPSGDRVSASYSVSMRNKNPVLVFPNKFSADSTDNALGKLATEVIGLIFERLKDVEAVVCFAITCQRFYEIGRGHLETRLEEAFTISWAGDRLICLGDSAEMDDLPMGMLTDSEVQILKKEFASESDQEAESDQEESSTESDQEESNTKMQLTWLRDLHPDSARHQMVLQYHQEYLDLKRFWSTLDYSDSDLGERRVHPADMRVLRQLVEWSPELVPDELYDGSYALRNLTAKEYIRGDAVRKVHALEKPWMKEIRLEHALIVRITWPRDSSLSHPGVWAGHRFDVSRITTVQNEEGPIDGWKDVSDEAFDEVVAVYEM